MENPIKVCKIDGISYPIIHDAFIDVSLPHVGCCMCKYAVCAKCVDLFNLNHEDSAFVAAHAMLKRMSQNDEDTIVFHECFRAGCCDMRNFYY